MILPIDSSWERSPVLEMLTPFASTGTKCSSSVGIDTSCASMTSTTSISTKVLKVRVSTIERQLEQRHSWFYLKNISVSRFQLCVSIFSTFSRLILAMMEAIYSLSIDYFSCRACSGGRLRVLRMYFYFIWAFSSMSLASIFIFSKCFGSLRWYCFNLREIFSPAVGSVVCYLRIYAR